MQRRSRNKHIPIAFSKSDRPPGGFQDPDYHFDEGRLSRPVGTYDGDHFSVVHGGRNPVEDFRLAVARIQIADLEERQGPNLPGTLRSRSHLVGCRPARLRRGSAPGASR